MIHADVAQIEEGNHVALLGAGRDEVHRALHVGWQRAVTRVTADRCARWKINGSTFLLLARATFLIHFMPSNRLRLRLICLIIAIITHKLLDRPFIADDFGLAFGIG